MPIRLSLSRTYRIPYQSPTDPDMNFAVTFKFPRESELDKEAMSEMTNSQASMKIVKDSIVGVEGFIDADTDQPIGLTGDADHDSKVREIVMQVIRVLPTYVLEVMIAMVGPTSKNLFAGVMQQSSGAGTTQTVSTASNESANQVEGASTSLMEIRV